MANHEHDRPDEQFDESRQRLTPRDIIRPIFRHWRVGVAVSMLVLMAAVAAAFLMPRQYESAMMLLVKRERADAPVSSGANVVPQVPNDVSEGEMNSEVELLRSRDLLEQVAAAAGLGGQPAPSEQTTNESGADLARVVRKLQNDINVSPIRKANLIRVTYRTDDARQARKILSELSRLYLEKHLALHRPAGAHQFFSEQTDRFRQELTAAEAQFTEYGRREQVVAADIEKESTLRQLAAFEAALEENQARVADYTRRITELQATTQDTPARQVTEVRTSENSQLVAGLKARVLELDMRLTDLLRKFTPEYPPVVEVEGQLAQARAALERTERAPSTEQVTDQNPTRTWLEGELARASAERGASIARGAAIASSVRLYRDRASHLEEQETRQTELRRTMKTAEDNYLLYQKKQEEARISDALDRTRIANVAIAEPPNLPALPSSTGRTKVMLFGLAAALFAGLASTYAVSHLSPYFYTPDEVEQELSLPVLAALPADH